MKHDLPIPGFPIVDAATKAVILALRAGGASFNVIAATLNKRAVKSPQGGRWYGATVYRVVEGYGRSCSHRCTERCRQATSSCAVSAAALPDSFSVPSNP